MRKNALGVYISIPFCRSKCTYCNFASGVYPASEHGRYVDRVISDMAGAGNWAEGLGLDLPRTVDSVYLGGGTPSLLEPEHLRRLFGALRAEFRVEDDAEITVECAPGQIPEETLEALAETEVNRISLGVQSFVDSEARGTGRLHNRKSALEDIHRLRAAGIGNLNIDLIAGLPGQTLASWEESLSVLAECDAPHASVYMLEVDEDSRLGREMLAGGTKYHAELAPSEDAVVRMYETAIERLGAKGVKQYEISNFAQPGFCARHNLRYWERRPYLGLGLDASSMLREQDGGDGYVLRSNTTDDLKSYLEAREPAEIAWLSPDRQHEEAWFLGLRLNAGVDLALVQEEFGSSRVSAAVEVAEHLCSDGLLVREGDTIRLTGQGRLLSNEVFQQFLGVTNGHGAVRERDAD